jgi:hypothetical protein
VFVLSFIAIIWVHLIADFALQSRYIAIRKGKEFRCLFLHGIIYLGCMLVFGVIFALVNGLLHISIDFVTSKFTSKFHREKKDYLFYLTIGIDQSLHLSILLITFMVI